METIAEILLVLLSIGIMLFVLVGYIRGRSDLVSIRNVALGGFVLFQTMSAAIWLLNDAHHGKYILLEPGPVAMKFFFGSLLFLIVALAVYARGWIAYSLVRLVPKPNIIPTDTAMWMTAILLTVSALVFKFAVSIPYINILSEIVGKAVAGTAAGFAGWLIARNLRNPFVLVCALVIIVANVAIAQSGEFGRRPLIALGMAVLFGLYYGRMRYDRPARTLAIAAMVVVPMVIITAAYTSIRGGDNRRAGFGQFVRAVASSGDVSKGLMDANGQGTGGVSLWLIEFFGPDGVREPKHFGTFRYFIVYPVPRAMYPFKPEPLSLDIPRLANLQGVNQGGLTIGPGIIGHCFADGGWHVVVLYACFAAVVFRLGDEMILRYPHAPFVVLPMGSMLGDVMGVSRGESSAMMFFVIFGTVTGYIYVGGIGKVLEALGYAQSGDPNVTDMDGLEEFASDDGGHDEPGYEAYQDYGEDGAYGEGTA